MNNKFLNHRVLWLLIPILTIFSTNAWGAVPTGWSQVTSLSGIAAGDKIIIVTNGGESYLNGSASKGHFSGTGLDASHPASASAAGVILLESTGTANRYKLKLVSTSKYITASAAKSGSGVINSGSDSYGWQFSGSSGAFNAQYQETGKQAYCRSYNTDQFRTYANTSSGATFKIYKYSSAATHTLSSAVTPAASGSVTLSATTVAQGSTADATATPAAHYTFTSWSISGTGASLSSTTTNPTTVTMGSTDATVTATFTAVPKASITLSEAGATTTDATTYYVGDTYALPTTTSASCGTKVLVGWSTVEVAETNTKPTSNFYEKGQEVELVASQTFYAVFATSSSTPESWDKVTSAPSDWSGEYVITNADGSNAMISDFYSGTSGEFQSSAVTLNVAGTQITSAPTSKMIWTVAKNGDNAQYSFKNKSTGTYAQITGTSSTNAALNASAVWFTIACSSGTCTISSVSYSARAFAWYSTRSSFRTYANTGNTYCNMYKKSGGTTYSAYSTTCCTPLASINGSFLWTNLFEPLIPCI